jgi:hypothetical protein
MDIRENKGGWLIVLGAFILAVLRTIGFIRKKEKKDD